MTNETKNVPELRFKEFSKEWEYNNLKDITTLLKDGTHGTHKNVENGPWLLSAKNIKNNTINISDEDRKISITDYNKIYKNYTLEREDILLSIVGTIGRVSMVKDPVNIAFQRSVAIIRFSKPLESKFFLYLFGTKEFKKKLYRNQVVSAQPGIYLGDLAKFNIIYPLIIEEQQKIGEFFSKLDRQIELEEQKLAKLEEQKKGYMQQIFSQKLRFKDENGSDYPNWEEVQLKDILIRRDHKQVPEINAPLMSFTSTGGIEPKGDRYNREFLVKNKNKKYKRTEFNDLIYSSNNLDVGAIGLNRYGASVISDVYEIFKIEEQVSPYFIEMSILQPEFMYKILRYRQGALYGQYRIHANDFLKINIELPCSEEQYKIGDFVNKLDNIIDIINNKIELLKQRKRGFLQKMFI